MSVGAVSSSGGPESRNGTVLCQTNINIQKETLIGRI